MAKDDKNKFWEFDTSGGGDYYVYNDPHDPPEFFQGSYTYVYPPAAQFIVLEVVPDFKNHPETVVEMLFNVSNILNFNGPLAGENHFLVETPADEFLVKGNWKDFKQKLNQIATIWD